MKLFKNFDLQLFSNCFIDNDEKSWELPSFQVTSKQRGLKIIELSSTWNFSRTMMGVAGVFDNLHFVSLVSTNCVRQSGTVATGFVFIINWLRIVV